MAAQNGLVVTGEIEIEGALVAFERVALPAELKKGTKTAAQIMLAEYQANVDQVSVSGSMRDAAVVRSVKRSRVRFGHMVVILRDKLFKLYEQRTGKPPTRRKGDSEAFFYPVMVELGGVKVEGLKPLRRSLNDNANALKAEAAAAILRAVNHPKVKKAKKTK